MTNQGRNVKTMETGTNSTFLLYTMHIHSHTKVLANIHFTIYTQLHTQLLIGTLMSSRQKLLHTPLVTRNTSTATEFKKTHSYLLQLCTMFQISSHVYTSWTHTYKHTAKNTLALTDPQ